ncbi:uncharacterized protein EI90DRAFT_3020473 [Cantharellus anzutake]|uniref:uncharacterized protein n=1 Tax=Cantharellus anzutake TaxID=1750568 RepID=UPI0019031519|nr:uncharacterized protein EI90DRAFT_3020473 [Cantharellus anzutake]KAF8320531.1 hypothetical protein EI90DRAFT_3020473 [Cantharellus anzutake]
MACRDVLDIVTRRPNLWTPNWLNDLGEGDSGSSALSPVASSSIRIFRLQLAAAGGPGKSLYNNMSLPSLRHLVIESEDGDVVRHRREIMTLSSSVHGVAGKSGIQLASRRWFPSCKEAFGTKIHHTTPGFLCGMASLTRWRERFPNLRYFYLTKASASHKPFHEGVSMTPGEWTDLMATTVRAIVEEYGGATVAKEDGLMIQLNDELGKRRSRAKYTNNLLRNIQMW